MFGTLFVLYYDETCDLDEVTAQLAELAAVPGVQLVPMVPAEMSDVVADDPFPAAPSLSDE